MGTDVVEVETCCDGSGRHPKCRTSVPHKHCDCGLPMLLKALYCALCVDEKELARRFVERERDDALLSSRAYHAPPRRDTQVKREYRARVRAAR